MGLEVIAVSGEQPHLHPHTHILHVPLSEIFNPRGGDGHMEAQGGRAGVNLVAV